MSEIKNVLYLGIEKPFKNYPKEINLIHYPIIKIIPRSKISCHDSFNQFLNFTHIIFTSKTAVHLFFDYLADYSFSQDDIKNKQYIAVGKATAQKLKEKGVDGIMVAQNETAEGVVDLLKTLPLKNSFIFWPHSSLIRNILPQFFIDESLRFESCILYDTVPHLIEPLPDLDLVDEIVFTSPSTVDAFLTFYAHIPLNKTLTPIGPITKARLEKYKADNTSTIFRFKNSLQYKTILVNVFAFFNAETQRRRDAEKKFSVLLCVSASLRLCVKKSENVFFKYLKSE